MTEQRRRRRWSNEEKCRIVLQTRVSGISVSQVARRYDVNANLIFKWPLDFKNPLRPTAPCVDLDQMVLGLYDLVAWNKSKQKNSTLRRHEDN